MNDLVFIENGKAVTDSLTVAEVFGKRHDLVMRDIRNLECSEEFNLLNFAEIDYTDERNRTYKKYLIKRDGLAFLIMGYTGSKAAQYKENYISAFNQLEQELKSPKILSEKEQLKASMRLSLETSEEVGMLKGEVHDLKEKVNNKMTLDHGEQQTLHHEIKKRVEGLADTYFSTDKEKRMMYSQIHSHLRRAFSSPSYRVVKQKDFSEAKAWVRSWRPLL
jgi:Rha family phage regulatory protein